MSATTIALTQEQQWDVNFDKRQIDAGNLEKPTHIEYKGHYICLSPQHTKNSLYYVIVDAGKKRITSFLKANYETALAEAKQIIESKLNETTQELALSWLDNEPSIFIYAYTETESWVAATANNVKEAEHKFELLLKDKPVSILRYEIATQALGVAA